jgi:hypothetical protein
LETIGRIIAIPQIIRPSRPILYGPSLAEMRDFATNTGY